MKPTSGSPDTPAALDARYANYFEVGHNAYEFFVDFGQYRPNTENVQIQLRVVTGPVFAKLLSNMLSKAVAQFEQEYGAIQTLEEELDPLELVRQSLKGFEREARQAPPRPKRRK
jgi:hypothetical protein